MNSLCSLYILPHNRRVRCTQNNENYWHPLISWHIHTCWTFPCLCYIRHYWCYLKCSMNAGMNIPCTYTGHASTVFIQIDVHALIDAHPSSSSSSWHTRIGEIDDFCIKNTWICGQIWVYHYAPASCLAHTQCATIRMNMVYHSCYIHPGTSKLCANTKCHRLAAALLWNLILNNHHPRTCSTDPYHTGAPVLSLYMYSVHSS